MTVASRAKELRAALVALGFSRDRSETREFRYVGSVSVAGGQPVKIAINFADLEFARLPTVTLIDAGNQVPQVVAHLTVDGELCFARNEDIVLDRYNVRGAAHRCVEMIRQGVERAITHKNLGAEIAQEFPQHWQGIWFFHDLTAKAPGATMYELNRIASPGLFLLADDDAAIARLRSAPIVPARRRKGPRYAVAPNTAVVLRTTQNLTFRAGRRQPNTLSEFLDWLDDFFPGRRIEILEKMASAYPNTLAVFALAPNGCVGAKVNGGAIKGVQRKAGLLKYLLVNAGRLEIERYSGERVDVKQVIERNLGELPPLSSKRVALIGCGTIGSHLAKFLVQSGAGFGDGTLYLLDNQNLMPGNIGRHLLGFPSLGEYKADALKVELERIYNGANIHAFHTSALDHLNSLSGFDLVIDATGEEGLSYSINQHFVDLRLRKSAPAVLHIRLFGNGAAAQGLLVTGGDSACFKCLRPEADGPWRYNPLKSGVAAVTTTAACGEGLFIAYGVAAPVTAAALALEMALDWNAGKPGHLLRTVRIDQTKTNEVRDKNPARSERCLACAKARPEPAAVRPHSA